MNKFLRIKQVSVKTGIAKSTIWLWVKENKFPQPTKISKRVTVWPEDEVLKWMIEKIPK